MKIAVITNIPSHYRKQLWAKLFKMKDHEFHFYFGNQTIGHIEEIDFEDDFFKNFKDRLYRVTNIFLKGKILIWQCGVLKACLKVRFDKIIFLGDMYNLTTWISSIICRFRNIEVIFWGHGLYGNENWLKKRLRILFFTLADKHLLYERRAKKLLINEKFDKDKLHVVFNSFDYDTQKIFRKKYGAVSKKHVFDELRKPELPTIIFIGRLTPIKRIDLLFEAALQINENKVNLNVVIIGDGVERNKLESIGNKGVDEGWLIFKGASFDEEKNARYLSAADLCVSPGNVGLTAIHSLSYGTPVCTHKDLPYQMPEVEAIEDGYNGIFFERNNVNSLKNQIKDWFSQEVPKKIMQERCYKIVDKYYNPSYQVGVIENMINDVEPFV